MSKFEPVRLFFRRPIDRATESICLFLRAHKTSALCLAKQCHKAPVALSRAAGHRRTAGWELERLLRQVLWSAVDCSRGDQYGRVLETQSSVQWFENVTGWLVITFVPRLHCGSWYTVSRSQYFVIILIEKRIISRIYSRRKLWKESIKYKKCRICGWNLISLLENLSGNLLTISRKRSLRLKSWLYAIYAVSFFQSLFYF